MMIAAESKCSAALHERCSWGSRQPPKLLDGVRILTLVLIADVARMRKVSALPLFVFGGFMLVRIQSSALVMTPFIESAHYAIYGDFVGTSHQFGAKSQDSSAGNRINKIYKWSPPMRDFDLQQLPSLRGSTTIFQF